MSANPDVLIVAQSGRMLAASAQRGGLKSYVIDLFGDDDTRTFAEGLVTVSDLTPAQVTNACRRLACKPDRTVLVYASGVEHQPRLIALLSRQYPLSGNFLPALRMATDPRRFFPLLRRLAIRHPETRTERPIEVTNWLVKVPCSEGGKGVAFCANFRRTPAGAYYQRLQPGTPCSLLFVADGRRVRPIGFNTLWHDSADCALPFRFAGAANGADLGRLQRAEMVEAATKLTAALKLRGINGLDFIADRHGVWLLELNPRPSATLQLHDGDWEDGLLRCHIDPDATASAPPRAVVKPLPLRAFRTVFAPYDLRIPDAMNWPQGCSDLPAPNSCIARQAPICTLRAQAERKDEVLHQLQRQEAELLGRLVPADGTLAGIRANRHLSTRP